MCAAVSPVPRHVVIVVAVMVIGVPIDRQRGGLGNMIKLPVLDPNTLGF